MRTIGCLAGVIAVCSVLNAHLGAGELSLGTNTPSGNPLTLPPGSTGSVLIHVASDTEPIPPRDYMTGWQTTLTLIPDTDAVGTLAFASVSKPNDYVFDTSNSFGINSTVSSTTNPDDTLFAFDFLFPITGDVAAPVAPRVNLLETELSASPDAAGTFGLFAISGLADTLWTDASQPNNVSRLFINVLPEDGPQRIGDVVVVPETKALQAGDADQNLQFDQFDIIKVSQSRKYITGEPATWGEGDWNGAPGGGPGNPPPGDGLFDQFDLISALSTGNYLAGPYAAVGPGDQESAADRTPTNREDSSRFEYAPDSLLESAFSSNNSIWFDDAKAATRLSPTAHFVEPETALADLHNTYVAVPEPQSATLLVAGMLLMLAHASRRSLPAISSLCLSNPVIEITAKQVPCSGRRSR